MYILPLLKTHIYILNYFVDKYGILEIYNKIFQYKMNLIDLEGNPCIASIVLDKENYIYKTIAIKNNRYIEPVDRKKLMGSG